MQLLEEGCGQQFRASEGRGEESEGGEVLEAVAHLGVSPLEQPRQFGQQIEAGLAVPEGFCQSG